MYMKNIWLLLFYSLSVSRNQRDSNLFCMAIGMGHLMKARTVRIENLEARNKILEFEEKKKIMNI